jgi:aminoglycoside phosphotransferase (APT) family kinase protein
MSDSDLAKPAATSQARDEAAPVRRGEELDGEKLAAYLKTVLPELSTPTAATEIFIKQFPGGYSNLTYLVGYGGQEFVLRRPPFGSKVKTAHDMGREFRILSALHPIYPRAPRPVCFCEDESILGGKFYLMERVRGVILRRKLPAGLDLSPPKMRALCETFVDTLVELHALSYERAGLADLGRPEGYVERQVSGWSKRYRDSQTDDVPALEECMQHLAARIPTSPAATLIHNDFKFDNLVLDESDPTRVIGLLDWEMATIGDPLMDLGTALCYWVDPSDPAPMHAASFGPTTRPGCLPRREIAARYAERSGRDLSNILFYYCFGLFKTAVVVQQIYFRYRQGLTQDPRFAGLGEMARILGEQAMRSAAAGSI